MITIKTAVSEVTELQFETPSFYKKTADGAIAIINENNVYEVSISKHFTYVQNGSLDIMKGSIASWCNDESRIDESEFIRIYNEARKATELNITRESIFTLTPEEQEERDRDREEERVNDYWERRLDAD